MTILQVFLQADDKFYGRNEAGDKICHSATLFELGHKITIGATKKIVDANITEIVHMNFTMQQADAIERAVAARRGLVLLPKGQAPAATSSTKVTGTIAYQMRQRAYQLHEAKLDFSDSVNKLMKEFGVKRSIAYGVIDNVFTTN